MDRCAGIIMHIASLPGSYGIGTFGSEAYSFVRFLNKSGIKCWQILPLGHTGYGDSPYQSFSAFAGNPYFIDYNDLIDESLLTRDDCNGEYYGDTDKYIDYGAIFKTKIKVLKIAYENYKRISNEKICFNFEEFKKDNTLWLDDYSLYMALKYHFKLTSWYEWDDDIKKRDKKAMISYRKLLNDEIEFWSFIQYLFFDQWRRIKDYAESYGIKIIGDIPIYVAKDSADTWSNPNNFKMDKNKLEPTVVSGCPPDAFSETGQLWGNLIYDWDYMKKNNHDWWVQRIKENLKLYDILRIDHFRGFESYWEVPYGDTTAVNGKWTKGPGIDLFNNIKAELGDVNLIAEDLGYLTNDVTEFLSEVNFPGMKVLQFAFDDNPNNPYLPHNYKSNCVAYTGTHDNDTFLGWFELTGSKLTIKNARKYLGLNIEEKYNWGFIRGVWSSVADIAIAPIQDFLNLGNECRVNFPSTLGSNWRWRADKKDFNDELANKIYRLTKRYGRCN